MVDYSEVNSTIHVASGKKYSIKGYNDLTLTFQPNRGVVPLLLRDVAHVLSLSYESFALRVVADN